MADEIRANYDELDDVATRFQNQSQAIQEMMQKVTSSMDKLENGGWIGRGSDAFFAEMHGEVLPAVTRLQNVLSEGSQVTKAIVKTMQQAEQEASSPFKV